MNTFAARARDSVRILRGKPPKYSLAAGTVEVQTPIVLLNGTRSQYGLVTEADVTLGTISDEERSLLRDVVWDTNNCNGPIIQFGTLLGETARCLREYASANRKVITIDPAGANPWGLPPEAYHPLVNAVLRCWLDAGQAVHSSLSLRDFIDSQNDEPPSIVFLNYVPTRDEATEIIGWAKSRGTRVVAGRGYDYASPEIVKMVDKLGGPNAVEGSIWRLNLETADTRPTSSLPGAYRTDDMTSAEGLVSIVIPAHNARDFIDSTLEDVRRQLYQNWELIVVEDGSIDDVEDVIRRFQATRPQNRVVYHRNAKNIGVSRTRNVAIERCRGEFVAFLDADDGWLPDHLTRKVRLLRRTNCDLAYSRVEMFDSDTGQALCTWGPTAEDLRCFPDSMFRGPYLQPSGVVVRRSLLQDVGRFDEKLKYAEDYDYWFRAIIAGKQFCFDEKVTSRYRKNHASAATTDRLVLCYDGVAEVTCRHMSQLAGDASARRTIVARHFLAAGAGHLAFPPTGRNGCHPDKGQHLLRQALRLGAQGRKGLPYYLLARLAIATRTTPLFRGLFRQMYKRCQA